MTILTIEATASRVLMGAAVLVGRVLLCLGVIVAASSFLAGCELVYQPACYTSCQAAGGNDAYSRGGE